MIIKRLKKDTEFSYYTVERKNTHFSEFIIIIVPLKWWQHLPHIFIYTYHIHISYAAALYFFNILWLILYSTKTQVLKEFR